jgi:hypothetical protein
MAKLIKYMGAADERSISKSDTFGGRLSDGAGADLVWNRDNHFIVDAEELGMSDEAVDLLLEDADFRDVTDLKRIPSNDNEVLFLGYPKSVESDEGEVRAAAGGGQGAGGTGGSSTAATGTTVGGSTTKGGTKGGSKGGGSS